MIILFLLYYDFIGIFMKYEIGGLFVWKSYVEVFNCFRLGVIKIELIIEIFVDMMI